VEGHINHLKMLKRHMFGRAHLDLLSRRFVLAGLSQHYQNQTRTQIAVFAQFFYLDYGCSRCFWFTV
jgi:hypothetical protein